MIRESVGRVERAVRARKRVFTRAMPYERRHTNALEEALEKFGENEGAGANGTSALSLLPVVEVDIPAGVFQGVQFDQDFGNGGLLIDTDLVYQSGFEGLVIKGAPGVPTSPFVPIKPRTVVVPPSGSATSTVAVGRSNILPNDIPGYIEFRDIIFVGPPEAGVSACVFLQQATTEANNVHRPMVVKFVRCWFTNTDVFTKGPKWGIRGYATTCIMEDCVMYLPAVSEHCVYLEGFGFNAGLKGVGGPGYYFYRNWLQGNVGGFTRPSEGFKSVNRPMCKALLEAGEPLDKDCDTGTTYVYDASIFFVENVIRNCRGGGLSPQNPQASRIRAFGNFVYNTQDFVNTEFGTLAAIPSSTINEGRYWRPTTPGQAVPVQFGPDYDGSKGKKFEHEAEAYGNQAVQYFGNIFVQRNTNTNNNKVVLSRDVASCSFINNGLYEGQISSPSPIAGNPVLFPIVDVANTGRVSFLNNNTPAINAFAKGLRDVVGHVADPNQAIPTFLDPFKAPKLNVRTEKPPVIFFGKTPPGHNPPPPQGPANSVLVTQNFTTPDLPTQPPPDDNH